MKLERVQLKRLQFVLCALKDAAISKVFVLGALGSAAFQDLVLLALKHAAISKMVVLCALKMLKFPGFL